jgi:hypothetical protein
LRIGTDTRGEQDKALLPLKAASHEHAMALRFLYSNFVRGA